MNSHAFSVNVSSLRNITVTDGDQGVQVETGGVQVAVASVIILLSLLALVTASLVSRRQRTRRRHTQSSIAEAIISSGKNRAVCREIEECVEQQRNSDLLGKSVL